MKSYVSSEDFIDIAITIHGKNMFQYLQIGGKKKGSGYFRKLRPTSEIDG